MSQVISRLSGWLAGAALSLGFLGTANAQWTPPPNLVQMGDSYVMLGSHSNIHVQDIQTLDFQFQCNVTQAPPPNGPGGSYLFTHTYQATVVSGKEQSAIDQVLPQLQADEVDCEGHDGLRISNEAVAVFSGACAPGTYDYEEDADNYIPSQGFSYVLLWTPVDVHGSPGTVGYSNAMASMFPWWIRNHGASCVWQIAGSTSGKVSYSSDGPGTGASAMSPGTTPMGDLWVRARCDVGTHLEPYAWWTDGYEAGGVALWACQPGPSTSNCGPCDQANGNILVGHPINPGTGNKYLHVVDIATEGSSSLTFERHYNSQSDGMAFAPPGGGWTSNQFFNIQFYSQGTKAEVFRATGQTVTFNFDGTTFTPLAPDSKDTLTKIAGGGYRFVSRDGWIEDYSAAGQVLSRTNLNGYRLTYTYLGGTAGDAAHVSFAPATVTDSYGRALNFTYAQAGTLSKVTGPDGYSVTYTADLDSQQRITAVTAIRSDGAYEKYLYGSSKFDGTNNPAWPFITGVVDGNGSQYSFYTYDQSGHGTSTSLAGGMEMYSMQYETITANGIPDYSHEFTSVTDPLGAVRVKAYSLNSSGSMQLTQNTQPGGSGCDAAQANAAYDDNGNKYLEQDFNGNATCHSYDAKSNLMVSTVEGLTSASSSYCLPLMTSGAQPSMTSLPAGARVTSYGWHPLWRLRTQIASSRQLTTYVYNGQPDPFSGGVVASCAPSTALLPDGSPLAVVCRQVTRATTDSTGAMGLTPTIDATIPMRSKSFTYDALGKVLTMTDSLGNTTTFAYYTDVTPDHMLGDLASVTNAVHQTVNFSQYDRSGRVLRMVDASGITTDTVYAPSGLVHSVTVTPYGGGAPMVTTVTYDNADLVRTVTSPDGSMLTYSYDAAHHLIGVSDSVGDTITYTLDNAGNRTGEQVKDASGNLAHAVTRVFDTLGRVQAVTGATQ